MLSKLRGRQEVLILLVVDIVDLAGSIHRGLPHIIGKGKPMIVIANKVDLLPPDARCGYLRRFKETVEREIAAAGYLDAFNILHTSLVSAKTGYGIEDLITEVHMKWTNVRSSLRDDIFLVGCTNAGKSTLFNSLLQSDLCKVRAVDLVERATTSVWPGTTLSLLKFPVMRPSAYKLELRKRRLVSHRAWVQKEAYARKKTLQRTGNADMAVLVEPVMNTFKEHEEELQPVAVASLINATGEEEGEGRRGRPWSLSDPVFAKGVWCYDTPGTINEEQILDVLSLRELVNVVPSRLLRPRTLILSPGKSLLIGGLARLDLLEMKRERPVWVTVFTNEALPLNVMETERTEEFMEKMRGKAVMGAPIGDSSRLASLPPMEGRIIEVAQSEELRRERKEKDESLVGLADIVFSSIGWAMVSTHALQVSFSASLPGGRGLSVRDPPILPYAALLRGARIPGTDFYKVNPPEFPVNLKRMEAAKNRRKFNVTRRDKNRDEE
ncbi:hypothetical protein PENTCL1PPCAC_6900 [Pristionchus entomophagus]|uniref:G domain-containing protein n=1 Tax=Pristionchus entomophagus TaxID=358040 RepID=A0AAV5SNY9_9BILA|nr:hypothetical protein PENTCL1PPCAC_6900 [Pristionchus entomophagus]